MNASGLASKLSWIIAGILVLLPFHAFFTTWLGSNFGHLDGWRIWKELIIFTLVVPTLWLASQDTRLKVWLRSNWLPRLILFYVLLHLVIGAWALATGQLNRQAFIYALLNNLRFLGFFMITLSIATQSDFLKRHWQKMVLVPAMVVILFGLMQRFVLPYDFLKHVGYGQSTIPAYQTVDNKIDYRRIQSTLRGANPLGAYLVLVIPALFLYVRKEKVTKWVVLAISLVVLFYSYSRSAWLGLALAMGLLIYWSLHSRKRKQSALLAGIIIILIVGGGILALRDNRLVQNTAFHTDVTSGSLESSNESRVEALQSAAKDVLDEPFGRGPGTAGPASFRNYHPRIAENYFLQVGQEVGWLGIGIFVAINFLVARMLWRQKQEVLAQLLLASLAGLTIVNLLSHAWADDTLALLWWGLAGVALSTGILNGRANKT